MTRGRLTADAFERERAADDPAEAIRRRAWQPEADVETAELLRYLNVHCWLVAGRDDEKIAAVRRHEPALKSAYGRLGWVLVVDRDLVRLRKSPPSRPADYVSVGPPALAGAWFFLMVAAADALPPRVSIGSLVNAARSAAAEAGIAATNDIAERRAIVAALRMLDERGVIERLDGELDSYLHDDNAPVLLGIHHTRLAHVIANPGSRDPADAPTAWLAEVHREPDAARRMRRALVDDTCVHAALLQPDEAAWLSQRVRSDDGAQIAAAFGLVLERRVEGAAFVMPEDAFHYAGELGPTPFPGTGTVPHAALQLMERVEAAGTSAGAPGAGWLGFRESEVMAVIVALAGENAAGRGGWSTEYTANPAHLVIAVAKLLSAINAVRITSDSAGQLDAPAETKTWWFAPVTGRWGVEGSAEPKSGRHRAAYHRVDHVATEPALFTDEQPIPQEN